MTATKPNGLRPVHPGEILKDEIDFAEVGTVEDFASKLEVPTSVIAGILYDREPITPDIAEKIAAHFGSSADLWLNLQRRYDEKMDAIEAHVKADIVQALRLFSDQTSVIPKTSPYFFDSLEIVSNDLFQTIAAHYWLTPKTKESSHDDED